MGLLIQSQQLMGKKKKKTIHIIHAAKHTALIDQIIQLSQLICWLYEACDDKVQLSPTRTSSKSYLHSWTFWVSALSLTLSLANFFFPGEGICSGILVIKHTLLHKQQTAQNKCKMTWYSTVWYRGQRAKTCKSEDGEKSKLWYSKENLSLR